MLSNDTERPPAKDPLFLTLLTTFLLSLLDPLSGLLTSGQEISKRAVLVCVLSALGATIRLFHNEIRTGLRIFDGPSVPDPPARPHSHSEGAGDAKDDDPEWPHA